MIGRRAWILAALAAALGGCGAKLRPNVVVLVMDTTRADRCSFLGYERPTTPRLAEFAKDAVTYRDAWSPASWTGPAHASLFTGLRPEHHGFHDGARNYLGPEPATLAQRLREAGYATGCFTSNNWIAPEFGLTRGFARVEPVYAYEETVKPRTRQAHELAAAWAEDQARAGKPFLLFINDMEPHLPYAPPEEEERRFVRADATAAEIAAARTFERNQANNFSLHATEMTPHEIGILSDLYDGEVASLDREIGALLDRLRAGGLLDSTIVVIAADHGELLGEHHLFEHGHSMHREVRHVPLMIRYPGAFDGGRAVDDVVCLEDVLPTVLDVCGLPAQPGLDGASLRGDTAGRVSIAVQGAFPGRRAWLADLNPGADPTPYMLGLEAVYDGRFHLLAFSDGRRELYDLRADPGELHDLATSLPGEADRLARLLPPLR